jgi:hypothetical protein
VQVNREGKELREVAVDGCNSRKPVPNEGAGFHAWATRFSLGGTGPGVRGHEAPAMLRELPELAEARLALAEARAASAYLPVGRNLCPGSSLSTQEDCIQAVQHLTVCGGRGGGFRAGWPGGV